MWQARLCALGPSDHGGFHGEPETQVSPGHGLPVSPSPTTGLHPSAHRLGDRWGTSGQEGLSPQGQGSQPVLERAPQNCASPKSQAPRTPPPGRCQAPRPGRRSPLPCGAVLSPESSQGSGQVPLWGASGQVEMTLSGGGHVRCFGVWLVEVTWDPICQKVEGRLGKRW